jgi:hypothetical protein
LTRSASIWASATSSFTIKVLRLAGWVLELAWWRRPV